ncbi:hypothetical protein HDU76_003001 [Blyttiomyces sp. JEL0837]|nr:hypothetical protein HDU76_003001 [Blyttiomyces sp. JEL0837]
MTATSSYSRSTTPLSPNSPRSSSRLNTNAMYHHQTGNITVHATASPFPTSPVPSLGLGPPSVYQNQGQIHYHGHSHSHSQQSSVKFFNSPSSPTPPPPPTQHQHQPQILNPRQGSASGSSWSQHQVPTSPSPSPNFNNVNMTTSTPPSSPRAPAPPRSTPVPMTTNMNHGSIAAPPSSPSLKPTGSRNLTTPVPQVQQQQQHQLRNSPVPTSYHHQQSSMSSTFKPGFMSHHPGSPLSPSSSKLASPIPYQHHEQNHMYPSLQQQQLQNTFNMSPSLSSPQSLSNNAEIPVSQTQSHNRSLSGGGDGIVGQHGQAQSAQLMSAHGRSLSGGGSGGGRMVAFKKEAKVLKLVVPVVVEVGDVGGKSAMPNLKRLDVLPDDIRNVPVDFTPQQTVTNWIVGSKEGFGRVKSIARMNQKEGELK